MMMMMMVVSGGGGKKKIMEIFKNYPKQNKPINAHLVGVVYLSYCSERVKRGKIGRKIGINSNLELINNNNKQTHKHF